MESKRIVRTVFIALVLDLLGEVQSTLAYLGTTR